MITAMEVNKTNTLLFSCDTFGFVYVWNIDGYCKNGVEKNSPECTYTSYIVL